MEKLQMKKTCYSFVNKILSFIKRQYTPKRFRTFIALFVYPIFTFYLFDLYTHNPFISMNFKTQVLNILFYQFTGLFLFGIFRVLRVALMLQSVFFMVVGLINYYVLSFRSAPIMPWDIYSLKTAASVADNFSYSLDKEIIPVMVGFLILLFLESRCKIKVVRGQRKLRVGMILLSSLLIWNYTGMIQSDSFIGEFGLYDKLFTPTVMNKLDGNVVAFIMELEYLNVEKPEGYQADKIEELLEGNKDGAVPAMASVKERPNIIVIMDEAFSDLSVLGEFDTNVDEMPFVHRLQQGAENTVSGTLNVSILGGNTANTEFEFLTSNTMAFLPQGSVAYQQYVNDTVPSLASYLRAEGYKTIAMHPYYASGWERELVYPMLGFDEFCAIESFRGKEKVRDYYSDSACFEKITDAFEKKGDEPLFLFNVTMQNHGGYTGTYTNFFRDVRVKNVQADTLNTYLSLLKLTDNALENLVYYFEGVSEDTIILFFGDHQPTASVSNPIFELNGKNVNELSEEDERLRYKVPFVMWANFDIEEETGVETSANYLAGMLLDACQLPRPSYLSRLEEMEEKYPVISAMQVMDADGNTYTAKDLSEELLEYQQMQYYLLFE